MMKQPEPIIPARQGTAQLFKGHSFVNNAHQTLPGNEYREGFAKTSYQTVRQRNGFKGSIGRMPGLESKNSMISDIIAKKREILNRTVAIDTEAEVIEV